MYKFPNSWDDNMKIDFLQRVIIIHSYLYYEKDNSIWDDKTYDEVAMQLVELQKNYTDDMVETQYGYCFYDFDGTTGFDLYGRLKESDREYLVGIAEHLLRDHQGKKRQEKGRKNNG